MLNLTSRYLMIAIRETGQDAHAMYGCLGGHELP